MMCNWKWIVPFGMGLLAGGIARDRMHWALRRRADESGYAAELFARLARDPSLLERALALVPEDTFCFCGKQDYCAALETLAHSPRCTDRARAGAQLTLLPPENPSPGLPTYWLPALLDRAEAQQEG